MYLLATFTAVFKGTDTVSVFAAAVMVAVAFESIVDGAGSARRVGDRVGGDHGGQSKEYSGNEETHCPIQVSVR
jgi:hypothetical protein